FTLHTNTRKLSNSYGFPPFAIVVQSQLFFTVSRSCTSPSAKYEVMRCPSAYCATSSGIAIFKGRIRTHPTVPSCARTRSQSSIGTSVTAGGGAVGDGAGVCGSAFGTESATQFSGGWGAAGGGGGPILACEDFGLAFSRGGGGLTGV